jgi:hypothetical protein
MARAAMDESYPLEPEQVIGRTLVEVRQVGTLNDENGKDWTTSYFILDSSVAFTLPLEDAVGLSGEAVPHEAERLDGIEIIQGHRIVGILRPRPDSEILAESLYVLFDNGYLVTDVMGGWHGTASTGLQAFAPDEISLDQLELVWGANDA